MLVSVALALGAAMVVADSSDQLLSNLVYDLNNGSPSDDADAFIEDTTEMPKVDDDSDALVQLQDDQIFFNGGLNQDLNAPPSLFWGSYMKPVAPAAGNISSTPPPACPVLPGVRPCDHRSA